jgi:hypothetical protein
VTLDEQHHSFRLGDFETHNRLLGGDTDEPIGDRAETGAALVAALEKAGVEFIAENGGGVGVRLRKRSVSR